MVDMATYVKMHPGSAMIPRIGELSDFDGMPERIGQDEDLTEDQLLILPSTTHGFSLREKKWGESKDPRSLWKRVYRLEEALTISSFHQH
jgi:hypothetical protein